MKNDEVKKLLTLNNVDNEDLVNTARQYTTALKNVEMKRKMEKMDVPKVDYFERRKRKCRKATGDKAPRKMLTIPQLREWEDRNLPDDVETESKEVQTFPSTSDHQVQCGGETINSATQTEGDSIIKVQKDLETASRIIDYIKDEKTLLYQRLGASEKLNKALLNERTSVCTKDCCKNST